MAEEHGYQRSGKKCKEKFENLYKYYKKTKEGKAGRQGGKHYRFFRQLEAIYGEASNRASVSDTHDILSRNSLPYQTPNDLIKQENQEVLQNPKLCESLSFSNSSELETSSSENNDDLSAIAFMMNRSKEKQKGIDERQSFTRAKKSWKAKIEEFLDSQMRKIMDTQEAWMDMMLKTIEHRAQESLSKEEEWRKQEAARFDQEVHELWTKERAWVEARDTALMDALKKMVGRGQELWPSSQPMSVESQSHQEKQYEDGNGIPYETLNNDRWTELEVSSLIQLRTSLEPRFQDSGYLEESLWEEIAAKMGSLGYDRSSVDYKEEWENISISYNKNMEYYNKKQRADLDVRASGYFQQLLSPLGHENRNQRSGSMGLHLMNDQGLPPSSSNLGAPVHRHRGLRNEGENLWDKYGARLN